MIDFGGANDHNKYIQFANTVVGYMVGFSGLVWAARVKLKTDVGTWGYLLGRTNDFQGWAIRFDLVGHGRAPEFTYEDGGGLGTSRFHRCTTQLVLNDWYSLVFIWFGTNVGRWYLNGVFINATDSGSTGSENNIWQDLASDLHICGAGGFANRGAAVEMDNIVAYPGLRLDADLSDRFAADYHAGSLAAQYVPPRLQSSRDRDPGVACPLFWWTGDYTPGGNIVKHNQGGQEAGATPGGAPTAIADECDSPSWCFLDLQSLESRSAPPLGLTAAEESVGEMPGEMYVEVTEQNRTYLGLKLELPDGIDRGFATGALPSDEQEYALLVKNWSPISRKVSDKDYRLVPVETSVVIADRNRELSRLFTGQLDGRTEGSPAKVRLISQHVASGSWMTVYEGELRRWTPRGNLPEITLYIGPNDKPMKGLNNLGYYTRALFPNLPDETENEPMQIVYGSFDSIIGGGPIACRKVSADGKRFVASVGQSALLQAYKAGDMYDPRSAAAEYTIASPVEAGQRWFTEVRPLSDAGSSEITVDMEGASSRIAESYSGYAFSNLWKPEISITNPAEQLLHFLVNFIWGAYERGQWLSPSADLPIDAESFVAVASWFRLRGIKGRTVIYGNETGYQLINRWASRWRVPAFWNNAGKLAVKVDDFAVVRGSQPDLIDREHGISPLVTDPRDDALADEVKFNHNYDWVNEEYDDSIRVRDLTRGYGITSEIDQDWSAT